MSELVVGSIAGLAANSYEIDIASGSTLDLTNAKAGSLPTTALGAGSILQVVQTVKTDTFTTTSGTFTTVTGLTATITPKFTSSKILVLAQISQGWGTGTASHYKVTRGGTDIYIGDAASNRIRSVFGGYKTQNDNGILVSQAIQFLDSPNSTSALTYQVETRRGSDGLMTSAVNRSIGDGDDANGARGASSITLLEVAA
jgi:hypothetical protein